MLVKVLEEKVRTPSAPLFSHSARSLIISKQAITRMLATPSLLSLILHKGGKTNEEISNSLRSLRVLVLQGEVVTTTLLALCSKVLPGCKIVNSLSISECHDITYAELYPNPCCRLMQPGGAFANCGPPINNVVIQVFIYISIHGLVWLLVEVRSDG